MSPEGADGVVDDPAGAHFLLEQPEGTAELQYRRDGGVLYLEHTLVPEELGGRGIGGKLVAFAAERARDEGLKVVPWCAFARRWLEGHPDAVAGLEVDWESEPPVTG